MGDDTYGYAYDPIGNRTSATENTETTGYTANGLNQYSQISAPSVLSVVHPVCDANGQQKSAKPKAQPPGDRDFEAARMRGARSRRRRRGGNCNVTGYVATNGASVARREYDPFGRTTVAAGAMADDFNFWFSTKYLDCETGMSYYGYRFYSPELGRWPSRDPIEERGGVNLYGFVGNQAVTRIDYLGLLKKDVCTPVNNIEWVDKEWVFFSYYPSPHADSTFGSIGSLIAFELSFNYTRKFRQRYHCCCKNKQWQMNYSEGLAGYSSTPGDEAFYFNQGNPSPWPPVHSIVIMDFIKDAVGTLIKWPAKAVEESQVRIDGYIRSLLPSQAEKGSVLVEPKVPKCR